MDAYLSIAVHEEYAKRMENEHKHQNKRISKLEQTASDWTRLLTSVENIAQNVERMQNDLSEQRKDFDELKSHDGKKWRDMKWYIVTTIAGIVMGYIAKQLGM